MATREVNQQEVGQREPKHLQLVSGVRNLCYAVEAFEELLHRVSGDEKVVKEIVVELPYPKVSPTPPPSLSQVLSELPIEIRSITNQLNKIREVLEELLF